MGAFGTLGARRDCRLGGTVVGASLLKRASPTQVPKPVKRYEPLTGLKSEKFTKLSLHFKNLSGTMDASVCARSERERGVHLCKGKRW